MVSMQEGMEELLSLNSWEAEYRRLMSRAGAGAGVY